MAFFLNEPQNPSQNKDEKVKKTKIIEAQTASKPDINIWFHSHESPE
jgi:predicted extracellular nuclease